MPLIFTRTSTTDGVCTLNQYLAGKDRFRAATRGIPCPGPFIKYRCSEKAENFPPEDEMYNLVKAVLDKYNIKWKSMGWDWRYQVGYYATGRDMWSIRVVGDNPTEYESAVSEIEQILIAAGTPKEDFRVEIFNHDHAYNDESFCIPDDPSLMKAISDIQSRVLSSVQNHIPNIWTSIAYHMRGQRMSEEHRRKLTIIIFCKPNAKLNWSRTERAIVAELGKQKHSNVGLHLELLPGQVERSTAPFVTHKKDFFLGCGWKLPENPGNRASIGVHTKDKRISVGTLGGWVRLRLPDRRSGKFILTAYDVVRDGDSARRTLNDHNGIGLHRTQPQSFIRVKCPAPLDAEATKTHMENLLDHKKASVIVQAQGVLQKLDNLTEKDLGSVVHASGRRISPSSNRILDWALIDSPSTFQRNVIPVSQNFHPTAEEWGLSLYRGEFIEQMGAYNSGDKLTSGGRSFVAQGYVNRIPRRVRWDDGTETEEDEMLGGLPLNSSPFASRGDVGSWVVDKYGELVGMVTALDKWTGLRCSSFVTPIKDIVQNIEATTGGKVVLP